MIKSGKNYGLCHPEPCHPHMSFSGNLKGGTGNLHGDLLPSVIFSESLNNKKAGNNFKVTDKKAFSIIEILVGIFIFSMGIISVFSIIINTLNLNEYNKNYIIAAGLAREQIELVRNIRDSNYSKIQIYNQINPNSNIHSGNNVFATGTYYKIENDFSSSASFPIKVTKIDDFGEGENMLSTKMKDYNLCLTPNNLYTYDCTTGNERTYFYKYIRIDDVTYDETGVTKVISDAFKVTSKVIWYKKGYKEFEITSIFTDFKRF